jgi:hypothetical protein
MAAHGAGTYRFVAWTIGATAFPSPYRKAGGDQAAGSNA